MEYRHLYAAVEFLTMLVVLLTWAELPRGFERWRFSHWRGSRQNNWRPGDLLSRPAQWS
jgi:hypothetical protein